MRPFTVAVIAPNVMPLTENPGYGGTERVVQELVQEWSQIGDPQLSLYCSEGSTLETDNTLLVPAQSSAYPESFINGDLSADYLLDHSHEINTWFAESDMRLARYEQAVVESLTAMPPDVIDCHVQANSMLRKLDSLGIPMLAHVHNDPASLQLPRLKHGRYMALSDSQRRRIGESTDDVFIAQPGITISTSNSPSFKESSLPVAIQELLHDKRDFLLYVGAIARRKSVSTAIQLAIANKLPIVVAGPILAWSSAHLEDTARYFKNYIEPLIDNRTVYHMSSITGSQRDVLMMAAMATIIASSHEDPSWQEPFGRVVPESLHCGTPVLAAATTRGAVDVLGGSSYLHRFTTAHDKINLDTLLAKNSAECTEEAGRFFDVKRYAAEILGTMRQLAFEPNIAHTA